MFPSRGLVVKSILLLGLCGVLVGCPGPRDLQLAIQVTPNLLEFGTTDAPQTFEVRTNIDTAQEITITSTVPASAPWLSVEPAIGRLSTPTAPFTATVHVDRTKLKKGLNTATISVGSPGLVSRAVTVTASTQMAADFVGDPKEIWQGEEVIFEDLSEVSLGETAISVWDWNFGDGTAHATDQNPTHTYATPGKKTVVLTVSSKDGEGNIERQDVETKVDYINVMLKVAPTAAFTTTPEPSVQTGVISINAGQSVEFTDASDKPGTAAITSWNWDFGDGQHSTLRNPTHTYNIGGRFTVSLTVTSEHGTDTETKSNLIFVLATKPTAGFDTSPDTLLANSPVTFNDRSEPGLAPIVSWAWDFGDGSQAAVKNPVHTYPRGGTYTVSLTVGSVHGTDTMTKDITVEERAPEAIFDITPDNPRVNEMIQFTDRSTAGTSPIESWEWDFGDGSAKSTLKNPTHKYTTKGIYTVTLKVVSDHGEDTAEDPVEVRTEDPTASFTATPTSSYVGHDIQFTSTSNPGTAPITDYLWTFGDGQQSAAQNPVHKYAAVGRYTVSLTVTSAHGQHMATVANYIKVDPAQAPTANFTMSNAEPYEADEVTFTDTSTNGTAPIATWLWEFGDGVTSAERNPVHVYAQPGTFQVTLTVTSPDGTNTTTKNINVVPNVDPVANFSATPLTPLAGTSVKFKDLSTKGTSPIISWLWNFGDTLASAADNMSVEQNPSHVYDAPGLYTVTLKVVTLHGTHEVSKAQFIQVQPRVEFTATPTSAAVGKRVQFVDQTNAGTSTVTSRLWEFGDGTTSTEEKPAHLYGREGVFTVKLTVTLANGATGSTTKEDYITVSIAGPTASFTVSNLQPVMFESVAFSDTSDPGSGTLVHWAWNFGDGTTSNAKSPFHTYTTEGTYTVTLSVTNSFDPEVDGTPAWASSTATKTIVVGGPTPVVRFTQDKTVVMRELDTVTFTSEASIDGVGRILQYQWYIWQGDSSARPNIDYIRSVEPIYTTSPTVALHEYPFHKVGYYNVALVVLSSTMTDPGDPSDPNNLSHFKATEVIKADAIEVREPSELDKFIRTPLVDPEFTYSLRTTITGEGYKAFFVDMTSQRWNGAMADNSPAALWKHYLTIVQPDNVQNETALLYLDGGTKTDTPPTTVNAKLASFAVDSGSVVISVTGIPNQPLPFPQRPDPVSEDDLIAASMDRFFDTHNPSDLVLFAMVKAAVRAMDTTQGFLADPRASGNIPPLELNGFVVAGGSVEGWSRGWATWLTAVADSRVKAIMPMGFDALNLLAQFPNQWKSLGFYSEALNPYVQDAPLGFDIYDQMLDNPGANFVVSDTMVLREGWRRLQEIQLQMLYDIRDNTYIIAPNVTNDLAQLGALEALLGQTIIPRLQGLYATYAIRDVASAIASCQALLNKVSGLIATPPANIASAARTLAGSEGAMYGGDIGATIDVLQATERVLLRGYPGNWSVFLLDPIMYSNQYVQTMQFYSEFGGRLNMPKYIMNSTGDVFTAPDSSRSYFGYMAGEKALRYFPNTGHDLGGLPEAVYSALPWFRQVVTGTPRPEFTWNFLSDQQLVVRPQGAVPPTEVKLWTAQAADRDFRRDDALNPDSPTWYSSTLTADAEGRYYIQMRPTVDTYTAYFVELSYAGTDGKTLVYTTDVRVLAPYSPTADFEASNLTPDVEESIQFFDRSRPGIAPVATWVWDFGDGSTSTAQNPVHAYETSGAYTVTLRITTAYGQDEETKVSYINVSQVKPLANFEATPTEDVNVGIPVSFTDLSTPGRAAITSWAWDFGDGSTSTAKNPTHAYALAGSYTVTLTVTSSLGSSTMVKQDYIQVSQLTPVARFTAAPLIVSINTPVQFTDTSLPGASPITLREWNFGDGQTATNPGLTPTHTYHTMGVYTVSLRVESDLGDHTATKSSYIMVGPDILVTNNRPAVGEAVKFTAVVGGASVASYEWLFGDGFRSFQASPVHQYGRTGVFDVKLTVTLTDGRVMSITKTGFMEVGSDPPVASFTASNYNPTPSEQVTFIDTSDQGSAAITEWEWNFGDGTGSTTQNPLHTYAAEGTYTVTLTITTIFGQDTATAEIVVSELDPQADFEIDHKIAYRGVDTVTFTSTSTVAGDAKLYCYWYAWKTGDTSTAGYIGLDEADDRRFQMVPSRDEVRLYYPFHEAGTYTVQLLVFDRKLEDPLNPGSITPSDVMTKEGVLEIREPNALDRYIHKDAFSYKSLIPELSQGTVLRRGSIDGESYSWYVFKLVAHAWGTYTNFVTEPEDWTHWLTVVQPDNLSNDTALLYLQAGDRTDPAPTSVDADLVRFALRSESAVAILQGVPNGPLSSLSSPYYTNLRDDRLLAATLDKFLTWPGSATDAASTVILFPMVKSVVKSMDAVQNILDNSAYTGIPPLNIKNFVLTGGSDSGLTRSWATWLTASTDERVTGLIPLGFDFLKIDDQLPYQRESLGKYSEVLVDYYAALPDGFDVFQRLLGDNLSVDDPSRVTSADEMAVPIRIREHWRNMERLHRTMLVIPAPDTGWSNGPYFTATRPPYLAALTAFLVELQPDLYSTNVLPVADAVGAIDSFEELSAEVNDLNDALRLVLAPEEIPTWHSWWISEFVKVAGVAGPATTIYGGLMNKLEDSLVALEEKLYTQSRDSLDKDAQGRFIRGCRESFATYLIDPVYYAHPFVQGPTWYLPYGNHLSVPKYLVNSTGDQYSMPDSAQFYLGFLGGATHQRYYPNTDHLLEGSTAAVYDSLPWYINQVNGETLPRFSWTYDDLALTLKFPDGNLPTSITLWAALSPAPSDPLLAHYFDFRYDSILNPNPPEWYSSDVPVELDLLGQIVLQVFPDILDASAYFLELKYPTVSGGEFTTATPVRIVPPYGTPFKSARSPLEVDGGSTENPPAEVEPGTE